ncbi:Vacuolar protein-sorting-associated protein 36 [Phlyctochytrium planicorne]|nr:Vacuolar protein-sorting-associated protein 36 [Phlyctochytrium planicorne]
MRVCEMCEQPLPSPASRVAASPSSRPTTPVKEVGLIEVKVVKLSFRGGGVNEFAKTLKGAVDDKAWTKVDSTSSLVVNVPASGFVPVAGSTTSAKTMEPTSSAVTSGGGGISRIMKSVDRESKQRDATLSEAFQDLDSLMAKASDMVKLAESITSKMPAPGAGAASSDEKNADPQIAAFRKYLVELGINNPVTREATGDLYVKELAREIAEFLSKLMNTSSSAVTPGQPRGRTMMPLVDLYCMINRARGVACEALQPLQLPFHLRRFERSGLLVVESVTPGGRGDDLVAERIQEVIRSNDKFKQGGVNAFELAQVEGVSVVLAVEQLGIAESKASVCRDDTVEGLRLAVAIAAAFGSSTDAARPNCNGRTYVKKDWTELSQNEQRSFSNAVKVLLNRQPQGIANFDTTAKDKAFADFTELHVRAAGVVHGTAMFYPFHRAMMWAFDQALYDAGFRGDDGQQIGAAYWDWSIDSQNWEDAAIFNGPYFGRTGTIDSPCLKEGIQVGWNPWDGEGKGVSGRPQNPNDPNNKCLRRVFFPKYRTYDPNAVDDVIRRTGSYSEFQGNSENTWHSAMHFLVGGWDDSNNRPYGDMADGSYSPNDIAFFFHHNMMDKTWARWQNACASQRTNSYSGNVERGGSDNSASMNDYLYLFGSLQVKDVMDSNNLCFTYSQGRTSNLLLDGCAPPNPTSSPTPDPTQSTTAEPNPTSTDSTSSAPLPTSTNALLEAIWFQQTLRALFPQKVDFKAPPAGLMRRQVAYNAKVVYSNSSDVSYSLPSTKASGVTSKSPSPSLPTTKTVVVSSSVSSAPIYTPTLKTSCGLITEVYAPKEVNVGGYIVPIPEGKKIIYKDDNVVKVVPMDYFVNTTTGESNYPGLKPKAIHPDRGPIPTYTPTDPKCTPPPTPHPTALSYPVLPPKAYYDQMGMDYRQAVVALNDVKAYIDKCNCDENCLSPAANMLREPERKLEAIAMGIQSKH